MFMFFLPTKLVGTDVKKTIILDTIRFFFNYDFTIIITFIILKKKNLICLRKDFINKIFKVSNGLFCSFYSHFTFYFSVM